MVEDRMSRYPMIPDPVAAEQILLRLRGLRLVIVGDIMLDEYLTGNSERVSPEAPVPIVRAGESEARLGGAANVACQAAALGAEVALAGLIGADETGDRILSLCRSAGIGVDAIQRDAARRSTRKLRVLARNHQMLRLDWEDVSPCPAHLAERLVDELRHAPTRPHAVILSDYAKGVLTPELIRALVAECTRRQIPVFVDPKRRDFADYRGCTLLTPNLAELQLAVGATLDPHDFEGIAAAGRDLIESAGLQGMVVTLSEQGMLLVPRDKPHVHLAAATPHPVADPTGAGDTVIATLAACLAAGATLEEAGHIANVAAGIVVCRVGAVAVDSNDLLRELSGLSRQGIYDRGTLVDKVDAWRAAGQRIVFTNGCFDLLHAGHLTLLHRAASQGDRLIVGINSDTSIKRLKGPERPIVSQNERAALLAALACVDAVTVFDEDTPLELIRQIRPDVLVKGGDYRMQDVVGREQLESSGGRVLLVPLVPDKSTTGLIELISRQLH